ncbi:hypothetical protein MF672_048945 [Actinomadura sp. ATCC 31491]|uniref:Uncharacterized protein n=1 Tax=Actinomadura luzonensis TaxID=2805427 RepID=A0ABT0GC42_9ACTN|nr:hypothetical protein [Actinomadura luzonensis]MCK2221683.1 hypothetical protein [Actinomadura luzonensis]
MRKRRLVWTGAAVTVAALAGLGVYFARVGLDAADKLSSVIGVFAALIGLALAGYGALPARAARAAGEAAEDEAPSVTASGTRSVAVGGDNSGVISTGDAARVHLASDDPPEDAGP